MNLLTQIWNCKVILWTICGGKRPRFHQMFRRKMPPSPLRLEMDILYVSVECTRSRALLNLNHPVHSRYGFTTSDTNKQVSCYAADVSVGISEPHICIAARFVLANLRSNIWSDGLRPGCGHPAQTSHPVGVDGRGLHLLHKKTMHLSLTLFSFSLCPRSSIKDWLLDLTH